MKATLIFLIICLFSFKFCTAQWAAIGGGFTDDYVAALFNYNNKIYIGGQYDVLPNHSTAIYSWDGINLTSISPPLQGNVSCINQFNNELTAFGVFKQFLSTTIPNGTVRWDGTNWYNLGAGITDMGEILAGAEYQGSLYIGGRFTYVDGVYRRCIARWDGSQWYSVGSGLSSGLSDIQSMAVYNGELYIGGYFSSISGVNASCIAKFNGTTWVQVAAGLNGDVKCLYVDSTTNRLYACGNFNASGTVALPSNIAYWDGSNWNAVANNTTLYPLSVCKYKNELYAGLAFKPVNLSGDTLRYIARWDGNDWQPLDSGLNSSVKTMIVYGDDLIVGGGFTTADTVNVTRIAKWHYSPNAVNEVNTQKKSFEIVPNPSNGNFTLLNKGRHAFENISVSILNADNRQQYSEVLNSQTNSALFKLNLSNGIYFVKISDGDNKLHLLKLVITR